MPYLTPFDIKVLSPYFCLNSLLNSFSVTFPTFDVTTLPEEPHADNASTTHEIIVPKNSFFFSIQNTSLLLLYKNNYTVLLCIQCVF